MREETEQLNEKGKTAENMQQFVVAFLLLHTDEFATTRSQ